MAHEELNRERRQHTRYLTKDGTYAVLSLKPHQIKLGRIADISKAGLAFFYESREGWPHSLDRLNILFGDENFYLDNIFFQTVTDEVICNSIPYAVTNMRRRGVMFNSLSPSQTAQLEYFIWHLTAGTK